MPTRKTPLVTNEIYHIFNRGINRQPTFAKKKEYLRALSTVNYYRFHNLPLSLSKFLVKTQKEQESILNKLLSGEKDIEVVSFCLMPNHLHLIVKQLKEKGISKFMSNIQNSYTKYFNKKNERDGPLFLGQYKAVHIETDEQLIHVSRYIHLNPYTSWIEKNLNNLENYPWSSLKEYLYPKVSKISNPEIILKLFKNKPDLYKKFVYDQASYQRKLKAIKHLIFE